MDKLFKTVDELKTFIAIESISSFENVAPYIEQAQMKYIIPAISKAQFDYLFNKYDNNNGTSIEKEGIEKLQRALAHFAYMLAIPVLQLRISDLGIHIDVTENRKTAFEHQIVKLEKSFAASAFTSLEDALIFMEDNTASFSIWAGSSAFTEFKGSLIATATEFNTYYNIESSRRLFTAMMPVMRKVIDFYIKPAINETFYNELIQDIIDNDLSSDDLKIVNMLKPAFAALTVSLSLVPLSLTLDSRGVVIFDNTGTSGTMENIKPGDKGYIGMLEERMRADGMAYLKSTVDYLNANASGSLYATFFNSSAYVAPTESAEPFDNDANNKTFFL